MRFHIAGATLLLASGAPFTMAGDLPADAVHLGCRVESNGVSTPVTVLFSEKLQALRWDTAWWDASIRPDSIVIRPTSDQARVRFQKSFRLTIDRRTGRLHLQSADGRSVWGTCERARPT